MWSFNTEKLKDVGHPAAFPIELPKRCIRLFTYKDDIILDPFSGSGTTAVACIREGRHFIGFELNNEYYKKSLNRISFEKNNIDNPLF